MSTVVLALVALSTTTTTTNAFSPAITSKPTSSSSSRLYISSFTKGVSSASTERVNPEENPVAGYLSEPAAVEARSNIDGTVVVSGLTNDPSRTDQFLFDLLNHEESAFEFTTIKAVVNDVTSSKKRLLSRSARYTGLLDKLAFDGASAPGALPTAEQLEGAKSWVAVVDNNSDSNTDVLQTLQDIGTTAASVASLENVAILLTAANELDAAQSKAALDSLKSSAASGNFAYTVVVVGKLDDSVPEGKEYYQYEAFGTEEGVLPADTTFSREESYRMVTELLQLACGKDQALCFAPIYNVNTTEAKLIRGLRQAGYARPQEIDHMIREGPEVRIKVVHKRAPLMTLNWNLECQSSYRLTVV